MRKKKRAHLRKLAIIASTFTVMTNSHALYYETLPVGVRSLAIRKITSNQIKSGFQKNGELNEFKVKAELDSKTLEKTNIVLKDALAKLKKVSPEAYNEINFGAYEAGGEANIDVQGLGVGYGITRKLTLYVWAPFYKADVQMYFQKQKNQNNQKIQQIIEQTADPTNTNKIYAQAIGQIQELSGGLIQDRVQNQYGYEPLGNWHGEGWGDIDLVAFYRLKEWRNAGSALKFGATLPTGKTDDPDILQDLPFGDGQTDLWLEVGAGVANPKNTVNLDTWVRFTNQFASTKTLRVPHSYDNPLSKDKGQFRQKLGNKFEYAFATSYLPTKEWKFQGQYIFNYKQADKYESQYTLANDIMAQKTESHAHSFKLMTKYSTISLFKRKKFFLPFTIEAGYQNVFAGKNKPKFQVVDIDLRFYF